MYPRSLYEHVQLLDLSSACDLAEIKLTSMRSCSANVSSNNWTSRNVLDGQRRFKEAPEDITMNHQPLNLSKKKGSETLNHD
jgi:hypothetical protein